MRLNSRPQDKCPACQANTHQLISLPAYPVTEFYEPWTQDFSPSGFFDQTLRFCDECSHLFLGTVLDAKFIYSNYLTTSASSAGALVCLDNLQAFIQKNLVNFDRFSTIIDIGGNDSSLLSRYANLGKKLINVDPNATGPDYIEHMNVFFEDMELSQFRTIRNKVVFCSHTLEHVEDPAKFINEISKSLNDEDVLFMQFPSLESLTRYMRFDQVCHQHINYFSLSSISRLLEKMGLVIEQHEFDEEHFGTLRLMARRQSAGRLSGIQPPAIERHSVLSAYERFRAFYAALNQAIHPLFERDGAGFGAGLMVPTLAYHLSVIGQLSYIYDDNKAKHNNRFVNLKARILPPDPSVYKKPMMVTSISTKSAARAIYRKLANEGAEYIVMPIICS